MRKFLRFVLFLLVLSGMTSVVKAEAIKQSFYTGFGPAYLSTSIGESEDNWFYYRLAMESVQTGIFNGPTVYLQTDQSWGEGYIISSEKQGGIGVVSFWCKPRMTPYNVSILEVDIQASVDGQEFATLETVSLDATDAITYKRKSIVINSTDAKYIKLILKSSGSTTLALNLDEIIITDAVTNGQPATLADVDFTAYGELEKVTSASLELKATNAYDNIKVSLKKGSVFNLVDGEETIISATDMNVGYELPIQFIPKDGYLFTDTLVISGSGIPETLFPIKGYGLSQLISEGFNNTTLPEGWTITGGSILNLTSNADKVYEGTGALQFLTSAITPAKVGGVGEITFMYRATNVQYPTQCVLYVSSDGSTWNDVDQFDVTDAEYKRYHTRVNNEEARYIKLENTNTNYSYTIIIDEFVSTSLNNIIPLVSVEDIIVDTEITPYSFTLPVDFTDIKEDIILSVDDAQFTLSKSTLSATEATGTVEIGLTYTPNQENVSGYGATNLTIAGGGLYFPATVSVMAYELAETLFSGFDGEWGNTSVGDYLTDRGWRVLNGSRITSNNTFDGEGAVSLSTNGNLISPPKTGGIGTIQFYARTPYSGTVTISVYTSENGTDWSEQQGVQVAVNTYENYDIEIGEENAKYIKIVASGSVYVDNFTITRYGVGIAGLTIIEEPETFIVEKGNTQQQNVVLNINGLTSPLMVAFSQGVAFSLEGLTTIRPEDINDNLYTLPLLFQPDTDGYFIDTLIFSGDDFATEKKIPVKGYTLQSLIYQDFSGTWADSGNNFEVDGWKITGGTRVLTANDIYTGSGAVSFYVNPNTSSSLLSVEKKGGAGTISFYTKLSINAMIPGTVDIYTYRFLNEERKFAETIDIPAGTVSYLKQEVIINDPEAKYVEIVPKAGGTGAIQIYVDHIIVTAAGEGTPEIKTPETIILYQYPEKENFEASFDLHLSAISQQVELFLSDGEIFELDTYTIQPSGQAEESITITLSAPLNKEVPYATDTIWVRGNEGVLPLLYAIPVESYILLDEVAEDFNEENWLADNGTAFLNGWLIENGRRETGAGNFQEGEAGLALTVTTTIAGSLRSPAKSGGINNVAFYYKNGTRTGSITFSIETSQDGYSWEVVDEVVASYSDDMLLYQKQINDKNAKYLRVITQKPFGGSYSLYIDSITIDACSYLRSIEEEIEVDIVRLSDTFKVPVVGNITRNVSFTLLQGNSNFFLLKNVITPEELSGQNTVEIEVGFEGAEEEGIYENILYLKSDEVELYIPLKVNYINGVYLSLVEEVEPIEVSYLPHTINLFVTGHLDKEGTISMRGGDDSFFTLVATVLSPESVEESENRLAMVRIIFDGVSRAGTYEDEVVFVSEGLELLSCPLVINYEPEEDEDKNIIYRCDFEDSSSLSGWNAVDLDRCTLYDYSGAQASWSLMNEANGNGVFMASSNFNENDQSGSIPADDWAISPIFEVIDDYRNYTISWESRCRNSEFPETYELRIIEASVLDQIDVLYVDDYAIKDASARFIMNSDLLLSVTETSQEWVERKINLNAYKGKNIRVIWRYIADNMVEVLLDNVLLYTHGVSAEVVSSPDMLYTQVPAFAVESTDLKVKVTNGKEEELTNVSLQLISYDENDNEIYSQTYTRDKLEVAGSFDITADINSILTKERYHKLEVTTAEGVSYENQTILYNRTTLTEGTYAWDNGEIDRGIGQGYSGFQAGQTFLPLTDTYLSSVTFNLKPGATDATSVTLHVYEMVEWWEPTVITSVEKVTIKEGENTINIQGEYPKLLAGHTYLVALEQISTDFLGLSSTTNTPVSNMDKLPGIAMVRARAADYSWFWNKMTGVTFYLRINVQQEPGFGNSIQNNTHSDTTVSLSKEGSLIITGAEKGNVVTLFNPEGQAIFNAEIQDKDQTFELNLPSGVYMVRLNENTYKVAK